MQINFFTLSIVYYVILFNLFFWLKIPFLKRCSCLFQFSRYQFRSAIFCCFSYCRIFGFPLSFSSQGSRLTFQLASPVASNRLDSLAKTTFSLARRRHLFTAVKTSELAPPRKIVVFEILIQYFYKQNTVFHLSSRRCKCCKRRCVQHRKSKFWLL